MPLFSYLQSCKNLSLSFLLIALVGCGISTEPTPFKGATRDGTKDRILPFTASPVSVAVPQHPLMAQVGRNSMHGDGYNSEVHPFDVVLNDSSNIEVTTRVGTGGLGGQCATMTFRRDGLIQVLCSSLLGFQIQLLSPDNLTLLATYKLPTRPSVYEALLNWDRSRIMLDSSGAYFYTDQDDYLWIANAEHQILKLYAEQVSHEVFEYQVKQQWDLSPHIDSDCLRPTNPFPSGKCDPITGLLPDMYGTLWWATRFGKVGTLNTLNGEVHSLDTSEEIQNGFAVAEEGIYIVSDHALYLFHTDENQRPSVRWRATYDRGSSQKTGSINQGSGTTPTLFSNYVTITDNADGRINLLVFSRYPEAQKICQIPLFSEGASATENSMIAFNRSVIIENNAGFTNAHQHKDYSSIAAGLTRIDVNDEGNGCRVVWESDLTIPSVVSKFSSVNGLIYSYTFDTLADGSNDWYLVAIDFRSGEEVARIHTGNGKAYNNNFSPITLGPNGSVYVGTTRGLLKISQKHAAVP